MDKIYKCPITLEVFRCPVVAADGKTYEREAIEQHIAKCSSEGRELKSPMTNDPLAHDKLSPNYTLAQMINEQIEAIKSKYARGSALGS